MGRGTDYLLSKVRESLSANEDAPANNWEYIFAFFSKFSDLYDPSSYSAPLSSPMDLEKALLKSSPRRMTAAALRREKYEDGKVERIIEKEMQKAISGPIIAEESDRESTEGGENASGGRSRSSSVASASSLSSLDSFESGDEPDDELVDVAYEEHPLIEALCHFLVDQLSPITTSPPFTGYALPATFFSNRDKLPFWFFWLKQFVTILLEFSYAQGGLNWTENKLEFKAEEKKEWLAYVRAGKGAGGNGDNGGVAANGTASNGLEANGNGGSSSHILDLQNSTSTTPTQNHPPPSPTAKFWSLSWKDKAHLFRILIDIALTYSPGVRDTLETHYETHKYRAKRTAEENQLVIERVATVAKHSLWHLDGSPRLYASGNPYKRQSPWVALTSTSEGFVDLVEAFRPEHGDERKRSAAAEFFERVRQQQKPKKKSILSVAEQEEAAAFGSLHQAEIPRLEAYDATRKEALETHLAVARRNARRAKRVERQLKKLSMFDRPQTRATRLRENKPKVNYADLEWGGGGEEEAQTESRGSEKHGREESERGEGKRARYWYYAGEGDDEEYRGEGEGE